jgi:GT2 family glycosyltransferase
VPPQLSCSVLVPVYNEERYIEQTLTAMRAQRFDGEVELLFADGGSSDRTREILQRAAAEDPRVRVFHNPRRSVSSGLNLALAHARGTYVARMDAHTLYPSDYLTRGVDRLQRGDTRWVSGPQTPRGQGLISRAVSLALTSPMGRGGSRKWGGADQPQVEFELDTGVFTGVWSRETLLKYGGWDERWPRNSDSEMAARFLANGERLICLPEMAGEYVPRDSVGGLWSQYSGYGRYRALTSRHHPESMRRSHLLAPAVVLQLALAVAAPRPLRRAARAGLAIYALAVIGASVRIWPMSSSPAEAAAVPIVLVTMHLGHGVGMLEGFADYGPPLSALARVAGLIGLAERLRPRPDQVYAPSLRTPASA